MKKLIVSTLCLLMLMNTNGVQYVRAEEPDTTKTVDMEEVQNSNVDDKEEPQTPNAGDKEELPTVEKPETTNPTDKEEPQVSNAGDTTILDESISEHGLKIDSYKYPSDVQEDGTLNETFADIRLSIELPKSIDNYNYKVVVTASNPDLFNKESLSKATFDNGGWGKNCHSESMYHSITSLVPIKEGITTITIKVSNPNDPNEYYSGDVMINIIDKHKGETLVIDKTELNLKVGDVATYADRDSTDTPDKLTTFNIGFRKADGTFTKITGNINNEDMYEISSNSHIIESDDLMFNPVDGWPVYGITKEFADNYLGSEYKNVKYIPETKARSLITAYHDSITMCGWGGAGDGGYFRGIIAKQAGSATLTYRYGTQEVSVKVNISDLSEKPTEKIPEDLENEFYNDNNASVNVNLTAPDTVKADVFKSAKETGKPVSFDIKGTDSKTQYAWTFNGKEITNPDMSLDLGIKFTSDKESNIRKLADQENMMFLSFNHHGALPGKAFMKINVSEKYKDGEYVFLNYFNEEKGIIESQGDKYLVKDGYVEFTIDHCSEYFLTTQPVSNSAIIEDTKPVEDDVIKNTSSVETGDSTMPIVLFSLLIVSGGMFVVLNKKRALNKK